MPITPFHFGVGALAKGALPARVSFSAFVAAQVVIDCETGYFLLTRQWPIHRWCHTFVLAIPIGIAAGMAVWAFGVGLRARLPAVEFGLLPAIVGGALGGLTHPLLDGIMHADIIPFRPFTDANPLFGAMGLAALHVLCVVCGLVGILLWRRSGVPTAVEPRR